MEILLNGRGGHRGLFLIVDDEDFHLVRDYDWCLRAEGNRNYAQTTVRTDGLKTTLLAHRVVLGVGRGQLIDHINGNGLDCRKENLRVCSLRENLMNQSKRAGTSVYKGVTFHKRSKKWFATVNGLKPIRSTTTENEIEAAYCYDCLAEIVYNKEFVKLNFPEEEFWVKWSKLPETQKKNLIRRIEKLGYKFPERTK